MPDRTLKTSSYNRAAVRWRSAAAAPALFAAGSWGLAAKDQLMPGHSVLSFSILLKDILAALLIATVITGIVWLVRRRKPRPVYWLIWSSIFSMVLLVFGGGASPLGWVLYSTLMLIMLTVTGYQTAAWVQQSTPTRQLKSNRFLKMFVPAISVIVLALWLGIPGFAGPGSTAHQPNRHAVKSDNTAAIASGPYRISTLTYGSGTDRRSAYGVDVDLRTKPVDGSKIITGWENGPADPRTKLWGFDTTTLPVNARVWYPQDGTKHPLVLIVHGNKSNMHSSEDGYTYLGEWLASHGYIVASIDENFLNPSLLDKSGGLEGGNQARAWLVLEHLRNWRAWSTGESIFKDKVDMKYIGLIGHSRGGEAIAAAAYFNGLESYPEQKSLTFDYGFDIKTLVALAPAEGQYKPNGQPLQLKDISYLTVQGSYDADVTTFGGINQYHRIAVTKPDTVKAAVKIPYGDHSQFNTRWGNHDVGQGLPKYFLDTSRLLSASEQQKHTKVLTKGFLDATLLSNKSSFMPLIGLTNSKTGSRPNTQDIPYQRIVTPAATKYSATYETEEKGVAAGFDSSEIITQPLRLGQPVNKLLRLKTKQATSQPASYTVPLPVSVNQPRTDDTTVFTLDIAHDVCSSNSVQKARISLTRQDGSSTKSVQLGDYGMAVCPMDGRYVKWPAPQPTSSRELMLQTIFIPLGAFQDDVNTSESIPIKALRLSFPEAASDTIYLDNVGITAP